MHWYYYAIGLVVVVLLAPWAVAAAQYVAANGAAGCANESEEVMDVEDKPVPLRAVIESTGACVGYVCGKCHILHTTAVYACTGKRADIAARESAERCCYKVCADCSEAFDERGWTVCRPCRDKEQRKKEQRRWDAAEKVSLAEYSGEMLFRDGFGNDGYVFTADVGDEEDGLEWAWGCFAHKVTAADCRLESYVIESLLEEHHEDAGELVDWAKVREAETLLVEACSGVTSYQGDQNVVVLLPKATK